jgi:transposase InsO family protein
VHPFTKQRVYLCTVIDLYSRWTYTEYHERISQSCSFQVLMRAQDKAGFAFTTVQADNGPEYGRWLTDALAAKGIALRHSRVRRPNDNAHIERFNRTIQEECLQNKFPEPEMVREQLNSYLAYYNTERLHLSLECRTPQEVLRRSWTSDVVGLIGFSWNQLKENLMYISGREEAPLGIPLTA